MHTKLLFFFFTLLLEKIIDHKLLKNIFEEDLLEFNTKFLIQIALFLKKK